MDENAIKAARFYVRGLFRGIPETARIAEQREELESHLAERISDEVASGIPFEAAFSGAVESLGNLEELVETMVGQKRKILTRKADSILAGMTLAYGTAFMIAVGFWFAAAAEFGWRAIFVAIPGWLGFAVPFLLTWIRYLSRSRETAMVGLDRSEWVRLSWLGWAAISAVCWLMNLAFVGTELFLRVIWAWMPTFGLLTWPLNETAYAFMLRKLDSIGAERRD